MADIFPTDERSPESLKRRVDHLKDMNVKELSRWILSHAVLCCNICENKKQCTKRYPIYPSNGTCVQGIEEWLNKQTGIYD
ncbi:MAG: hypothetical protein J6U54_20225 [Clostridiales bacterium]|nr:hypothetical protein [Clostridiales bacterium]